MSKLDLEAWRGVLVISGDSLVHEVYNGLFIRYTPYFSNLLLVYMIVLYIKCTTVCLSGTPRTLVTYSWCT